MDQTTEAAIKLAAGAALGWGWQMARSLKAWHNGLSWIVFGLGAVAVYVWATPQIDIHNWRAELFGAVTMVLAARGSASASGDAKIAPKTDSL